MSQEEAFFMQQLRKAHEKVCHAIITAFGGVVRYVHARVQQKAEENFQLGYLRHT